MSETGIHEISNCLQELHAFINSSKILRDYGNNIHKEDTILSLLGSFSYSEHQTLHWDYDPKGINIPVQHNYTDIVNTKFILYYYDYIQNRN